jgi:hypothetical protein
VSAALKRAPEPTPAAFASPERAALAHAIAAAADAGARKAALERASQNANSDVMRAIGLAEAAEAALAEAQGNTIRHVVDKALGTAGAAPVTIREARAAVIEAQDHLEESRGIRAALKAELDAGDNGLTALRVTDAARAVVRVEMQQRAVALAGRVAKMQREIVAAGSGLEWLSRAGVFPERNGAPADENIRHTVSRMELAPNQWVLGTIRYAAAFAEPTGALAWEAAFEALKRDAATALPEDLA